MYYYIYKTTHIESGKFYIGLHKTNNLNDGYLGSGSELKADITLLGKDKFFNEKLEYFDTEKEMIAREEEIVTKSFIKEHNVYNKMPGGKFGSLERNGLSFKGKAHSNRSKQKISAGHKGTTLTSEHKKKISENNYARREPDKQRESARKGGQHPKSESHRKKISAALTGRKRNTTSLTCPHCGKSGARNGMTRWHFDNCKHIGVKSTGSDTTL